MDMIENEAGQRYTAFAGTRLIVSGDLRAMLVAVKEYMDGAGGDGVLIFEDETGKEVDFDFRGTVEEVLARVSSHPLFAQAEAPGGVRTGPGRPKLGVVCREVSLLPRHWDWLDRQPGSVSATLRKLVDAERKRGGAKERARVAWEAAGKFMWAMAGNLPDFEEASRALYAKDITRVAELTRTWPGDVRDHLKQLAEEGVRRERESSVTTQVEA